MIKLEDQPSEVLISVQKSIEEALARYTNEEVRKMAKFMCQIGPISQGFIWATTIIDPYAQFERPVAIHVHEDGSYSVNTSAEAMPDGSWKFHFRNPGFVVS